MRLGFLDTVLSRTRAPRPPTVGKQLRDGYDLSAPRVKVLTELKGHSVCTIIALRAMTGRSNI